MDFYRILVRETKDKELEIYPDFIVGRSEDLMVQGGKFYAIWDPEKELWSRDEYDVQRLVDADLVQEQERLQKTTRQKYHVKLMRSFHSNVWTQFRKFMALISDNSKPLDNKLVFANTDVKKKGLRFKEAAVRYRRRGYSSVGRVDLYVVFSAGTSKDRMGDRLYCLRGLEEDSKVLRALWATWYGQEYDLEHYPSIVRGVYHNLRWESVRKLERIFRDGSFQVQSPRSNSARWRSFAHRRQCAAKLDNRPRTDDDEREVQGELFGSGGCDAVYWLEPAGEDLGC
jgi:hypothetical protein